MTHNKSKIEIYDTTLRDGTQAEDISFSVADKVKIAQKLDELGIDFIEGGWPGSNPRDNDFFDVMKNIKLKKAKLVAFGSTCRHSDLADDVEPYEFFKPILDSGVKHVCLFGKTWDLHVKEALNISLKDNLRLIEDSIIFLKKRKLHVIFDAEHFFDGYKANARYAVQCLKQAEKSGADMIVLCDTNGGALPSEIIKIINKVKNQIKVSLGIHCHNDSELGVANSLAAIEAGVSQVQGSVNGIGERCGNANLISIIPNLELKMGIATIGRTCLKKLNDVAHFVDQTLNHPGNIHQPFVGRSAFAHKGGVHVNAVLKNPLTYEHINPKLVGSDQRILLSDLSGRSTLRLKLQRMGIDLKKGRLDEDQLLSLLKERENLGYQYEDAEASFFLLARHAQKKYKPHFELIDFSVSDEITGGVEPVFESEACLRLKIGPAIEKSKAMGVGPVHALDRALRKILVKYYPALNDVSLVDYKVRVLSSNKGTKASVRVHIDFSDNKKHWSTVGMSENIILASYQALVDGIDYFLMTN